MDRWDWMTVRAYLPAAAALAVAFIGTWVTSGWQQSPYLVGLFGIARWLPLAAVGFALVHGGWVTYRLSRAERGEGLLCECGGLLGAEQEGRYGAYRKCLACSRNVARRHYE